MSVQFTEGVSFENGLIVLLLYVQDPSDLFWSRRTVPVSAPFSSFLLPHHLPFLLKYLLDDTIARYIAQKMKVSAKLTAVISLLWNSSQLSKAQELCSCSPRKYSFTLSLSQTCNDDTLQSSPGVFTTVCSTDTNVEVDGDWSDLIPDVGGSLVRRSLNLNDKPVLRLAEDVVPIKIVSIVFAEVNSDGSLVIINKDESFADADLGNGAIVEFDSISNTLDSNVVLQDQSDVPGGVTVLLVGENADGKLVKTRMLWLYKNDCDLVPLAETSDLGWISVVRRLLQLATHSVLSEF